MGYPGNGSAVIDDPDQLAQADANEPAGPDEGGQPAPPETDAYPAAPDQPSPVQAVPLATTPPAQPIAPLVNQAAGPVMGTRSTSAAGAVPLTRADGSTTATGPQSPARSPLVSKYLGDNAPYSATVPEWQAWQVTHEQDVARQSEAARVQQDRTATEQQKVDAKNQFDQQQSQFEAEANRTGAQTWTDAAGVKHQSLDESGRPLFKATPWQRTMDPTTGTSVLARRNELGGTEQKPGKVVAGKGNDPYLYRDFGDGNPERIGHVDDLATSPDPEVQAMAVARQAARGKVVASAGREPLAQTAFTAQAAFDDAKQMLLDTSPQGLTAQMTAGNPLAAERYESMRENIQAGNAGSPGGKLWQAKESAALAVQLYDAQVKLKQSGDLADQVAERLTAQGKDPAKSPVWQAIKAKEAEIGADVSQMAQAHVAHAAALDTMTPKAQVAVPAANQPTPDDLKVSASDTAGLAGATAVVPSLGAWGGAEAGVLAGAAIPVLGETGIGELLGGFIGAIAGSIGANKAQRAALKAADPGALDELDRYQAAGQAQHPVAAFAGDLLGSAGVFKISPLSAARGAAAIVKAGRVGVKGLTATEKVLAKVFVTQAGLGAAGGVVSPLLEGQAPTAKGISDATLQALLLGEPRFGGHAAPAEGNAGQTPSSPPGSTETPPPPVVPPGTPQGEPPAPAGVGRGGVPMDADVLSEEEKAQHPATPVEPLPPQPVVNDHPNVAGPPLEGKGDWTGYSPESGSLGIPRSDMPQVKNEHRGALVNFLGARAIGHSNEEVLPGTLQPSQAEYSPGKVETAASRLDEANQRPILVSKDNRVIDGHHQWTAALRDRPDQPIKVIRLHANADEVIARMKDFPSAESAPGAEPVTPPAVDPNDLALAAEPVASIVARTRTNPTIEYAAAVKARIDAAKRIAATLRVGDVITTLDGLRLEVFHDHEGNPMVSQGSQQYPAWQALLATTANEGRTVSEAVHQAPGTIERVDTPEVVARRTRIAEKRHARLEKEKAKSGTTPAGGGAAQEPAKPVATPPRKSFKLAPDLAKIAPRYKQHEVRFASDLDRALYTVANPKTDSKRHADLMRALMEHTGLDEPGVRRMGEKVRAELKKADDREPDEKAVLTLPRVHDETAAPKAAEPPAKPKDEPKPATQTIRDIQGKAKDHPADQLPPPGHVTNEQWQEMKDLRATKPEQFKAKFTRALADNARQAADEAKRRSAENPRNTPRQFVQTISGMLRANLRKGEEPGPALSRAIGFLSDFARRVHGGKGDDRAKAFEAMKIKVLTQKEWETSQDGPQQHPKGKAGYDSHTNTLYLNTDRLRPENIVETIVHEAGHFAERFALGVDFTRQLWGELTDAERMAAWKAYSSTPKTALELRTDSVARAEWVAFQFSRVVRDQVEGMNPTMLGQLREWAAHIRDLVGKWVGSKDLSKRELDAKIIAMMRYDREAPGAEVNLGGRGKPRFGSRHDGTSDIIDAIQEAGGVPRRPEGHKGGEFDGIEGFRTSAPTLMGKGEGGWDQFMDSLIEAHPEFEGMRNYTAGDLLDAVNQAKAGRLKAKGAQAKEEKENDFMDAALNGKGRSAVQGVDHPRPVDSLRTGDKFEIKGEPFEVTEVDEHGRVTVKGGDRSGTQTLPAGEQLHADEDSFTAAKYEGDQLPPPPEEAYEPATKESDASEESPFNEGEGHAEQGPPPEVAAKPAGMPEARWNKLDQNKQNRLAALKAEVAAKLKGGKSGLLMAPEDHDDGGLDPDLFSKAGEMMQLSVESGETDFVALGKEMIETFGEKIRPFLPSMYAAARNQPGVDPAQFTHDADTQRLYDQHFRPAGPKPAGQRAGQPEAVAEAGVGSPGHRQPVARTVRPELIPEPAPFVQADSYAGHDRFRLDPDQVLGVNAILTRFAKHPIKAAFLLADGTGFGKTAQLLAVIDHYQKANPAARILYVTGSKAMLDGSWTRDARRMGIDLRNVDATTYSSLGNMTGNAYDLAIFDEAQNLKNGEAKKSINAARLDTRHTVFATATPMDKMTGAAYFLAQVTGRTETEIADQLGYHYETKRDTESGKDVQVAVLNKGMTSAMVWQRIANYRDAAIEAGAMLRREYPFYGTVGARDSGWSPEHKAASDALKDHWDKVVASARSQKAKKDLSGQRTQMLKKWSEITKVKDAFDQAMAHIKTGGKVVLVAGTDKEQSFPIPMPGSRMVRGPDGMQRWKVDGALTQLDRLFTRAGVEMAHLHDTTNNKISDEVDKFQDGDAPVALATARSGGTGINLDDTVGDKPRLMIKLTADFAGDVDDQLNGRISRKTTQSPSEIRGLFNGDAWVDHKGRAILEDKMRTLRAIQGGEDPDRAGYRDVSTTPDDPHAQDQFFAPEDDDFSLESRTPGEIAEEARAAKVKAKLDAQRAAVRAGLDAPLRGDSSAVGQGALLASEADLFSGMSQEDMSKKLEDDGAGRLFFAPVDDPEEGETKPYFYSRLTRAVENSPQGKATGATWEAMIRNGKMGANADEMALVGLGDLERNKTYTKGEVLDYLRANQVQVKDVTLGGAEKPMFEAFDNNSVFLGRGETHQQAEDAAMERIKEMQPELDEEQLNRERNEIRVREADEPEDDTHFSQYQLPGAVEGSYREVLLTVPPPDEERPDIRNDRAKLILAERAVNRQPAAHDVPPERREAHIAEMNRLIGIREAARASIKPKMEKGIWRDGHDAYSEHPNPIVRLRFNERTTADGKKLLFLEEVQPPQKGQFEKMPALFQKKWREIAFKWALRKAADMGVDAVGWTRGDVQADRYDLSKQVEKIGWNKNDDGTYGVNAVKTGEGVVTLGTHIPANELEANIGKDAAKKIMEGGDKGQLTGLDLKVGGEGLRKLYDVDFRNVVNGLPAVKKSGQKVGEGALAPHDPKKGFQDSADGLWHYTQDDTGWETEKEMEAATQSKPINSLALTPAIKSSVREGQYFAAPEERDEPPAKEGLDAPGDPDQPAGNERHVTPLRTAAELDQRLAADPHARAAREIRDADRADTGLPAGQDQPGASAPDTGTDEGNRGTGAAGLRGDGVTREANQNLVRWAQRNNRAGKLTLPEQDMAREGGEHHVALDLTTGRYLKSTIPPAFGFHPHPSGPHSRGTADQYLDRIALQNSVFGDDIRVESVNGIGNAAHILTSQPDYGSKEPDWPEQIKDSMAAKGFARIGPAKYYNPETRVFVDDAQLRNFRELPDGTIHPFDVQVRRMEGVEAENLGKVTEQTLRRTGQILGSPAEEDEPETRNLLAVHNTTEEKLEKIIKLGGLAVPSVAIIRNDKGGYANFGDISLVGGRDLVDPRAAKSNRVFNADIYSPRFPTTKTFLTTADESALKSRFVSTKEGLQNDVATSWGFSTSALADGVKDEGMDKAMRQSPLVMLAWAKETGQPVAREIPAMTDSWTVREALRKAVAKNEDGFKSWAEAETKKLGLNPDEKMFAGRTNMGNTRYVPLTLDRAVRELNKAVRDGEGFTYGVGNIRAKVAKQFRSVEQMQADRNSIVSSADMNAHKEKTDANFVKLADDAAAHVKAGGDDFGFLDAFVEHIREAIDTGNWDKTFAEYYRDGYDWKPVKAFVDSLRTMPTEYFEAKLGRAVSLGEFKAAVIPDSTSQGMRAILRDRGLTLVEYPRGDETARAKAIQGIESHRGNLLFSPPDENHPPSEAPETMRRGGQPAEDVGYNVRPTEVPHGEATAHLAEHGPGAAERNALDKANPMPLDTRVHVFKQLRAAAYDRLKAATTPAEKEAANNEFQRLVHAEVPVLSTEVAQGLAARRLDKDGVAAATQYVKEVGKQQDADLGPDGKKAITETGKKLDDVDGKAIITETKPGGQVDNDTATVKLSRSVWQEYKDHAAQKIFDYFQSLADKPRELPPMEAPFFKTLMEAVKDKLKPGLPEKAKDGTVPLTPIEKLKQLVEEKAHAKEMAGEIIARLEKEHGKDSPIVDHARKALMEMGALPYSGKMLDAAVRQAHTQMRTNVREVARQHWTQGVRSNSAMADALVRGAGISQQEAATVASDLFNRMREQTMIAKANLLAQAIKREQTRGGKKVLDALQKIMARNNWGGMNAPELANAVAREMGIAHVTPEQMAKMGKLGDAVETAPNLAAKARATIALAKEMHAVRNPSRWNHAVDTATSVWYANLLGGTSLVTKTMGDVLNTFSQLSTTMVANPLHTGTLLKGWLDGLAGGWERAKDVMSTGNGGLNYDVTQGGYRHTNDATGEFTGEPRPLGSLEGAKNPWTGTLKYVPRAFKAIEAMFYHPAAEAYSRLVATKLLEGDYHGAELEKQVQETLGTTPEIFNRLVNQAKEEGFDKQDIGLRVGSLIQDHRARSAPGAQARLEAQRYGNKTVFAQEPTGFAGVLYKGVAHVVNNGTVAGVPVLKAILPFLKIPTNLFNESLNYTPMGIKRAVWGTRAADAKGLRGRMAPQTDMERNQLIVQGVLGTALMAGLTAAIFKQKDNDVDGKGEPWFNITGAGPADYNRRLQLQQNGWVPHAIKLGDHYFPFIHSPYLIPLSMVGNVADNIRYAKEGKDAILGSRVADAAVRSGQTIFSSSMLSGLANAMDFFQDPRTSPDKINRFLAATGTSLVVPSGLKQLDMELAPTQHSDNGPLGVEGAALPIVRREGTVRSDNLGQPITSAPSQRYVSTAQHNPLLDVLNRQGIVVPGETASTKIAGRPITPAELVVMQREVGGRVNDILTRQLKAISNMKPEQAKKFVDTIVTNTRDSVKAQLPELMRQATAGQN